METNKTDMDLLEHLALRNDDWINMVRSFGPNVSLDTANNITQEMYIRMHKYVGTPDKIMYGDDDINTMYVYVTLRNLYTTYIKENYLTYEYLDEMNDDVDDFDESFEIELITLQNKIISYIDSWNYYDSKLCKLILLDNIPMRRLSRDTSISLYSISNSVNNYKKKLNNKFGPEYERLLKLK